MKTTVVEKINVRTSTGVQTIVRKLDVDCQLIADHSTTKISEVDNQVWQQNLMVDMAKSKSK